MASEILPGLTILEALNTDLVCDAINTAMRELFLQIVYGRSQSAFSEDGLVVGAGLEDLGKGLRSQVGTMYGTLAKGPRYLEMTDGYVTGIALDADDEIIGSLGLGIVRFNEVVTPEVIAADYEYRVDTDVVTTVTISGGQSDPDHPVSVTFSILGRNYTVNNVYYPEDGQQLVWVKWHTPSTEQYITINVSVSGGGSASKGTITANIVDLDRNPPPNPVADDRNDSYNAGNAIIPANPQKTSASWSVWRPWWKEKWVWHSDWKWKTGSHTEECKEDCESSHGYWEDEGEYVDEGWWEFSLDRYSASLSATMDLTTDAKSPTATATTIKSGYGVNISVNASASTGQSSATTPPQTAVSYFPEFYYKTYWRLLDRTRSGYHAGFEFRNNHYSTYNRRTHFTPVWMPNGTYTVYTYLLDCWTPDGMLSVNLTDSVQISGDLWDDWHIAPQRAR